MSTKKYWHPRIFRPSYGPEIVNGVQRNPKNLLICGKKVFPFFINVTETARSLLFEMARKRSSKNRKSKEVIISEWISFRNPGIERTL